MCYGWLVRKAELSVLGTVPPGMQSTQHTVPEELEEQSHLHYLDSRLVGDVSTSAHLTRPSGAGFCPLDAPGSCPLLFHSAQIVSLNMSQCSAPSRPRTSTCFPAIQYFFLMIGHIGVMSWWPHGQFLVELSLCYDEYSQP